MDTDCAKNYYAILGVSHSATQGEIKRAYHKLARRYHPDSRAVHTPTVLFREVHQAYAVLSDVRRRRAYDRRREQLGKGPGATLTWEVLLSRKRLYTAHREQMLYALVEVKPATKAENERLPLNLCLAIDRSTSMKGTRLENVKEAARQIADELLDDDALAAVAFDDRAEVVLPSQPGGSRAQAKAKITALRAGGGTEILRGMRAGLAELKKHHRKDAISHLILLTDGRTYGDDQRCLAEAEKAREKGIGITAMGIGDDWNDVLLDEIASRSGGTSAYIASPGQVRALLQKKVRSLGTIFAKGLTLTVRGAEGVTVEGAFLASPRLEPVVLSGGTITLGSLEADAPMGVILEMGVERKPSGEHRLLQLELNGDVPLLGRQDVVLKRDVRCVFTDDELDQEKDSVPSAVVNALGRITLYRMQEQAWSALDEGNIDRATRQLEMVATRLLDLGEKRLAQAAMLEAAHVAKKGDSTARGRKEVKYGTRSLDIGREAND